MKKSSYGMIMIIIGILILIPLLVLIAYPSEIIYAIHFIIPGSISILFGIIICSFTKNTIEYENDRRLALKSSSIILLFSWFWGIIVGSLPFITAGILRPIQAIFESVSGWTTTGLSVIDVTKISNIFLFYRSFMQYAGGLGFVLVMTILVTNKRSMDLCSAEGHTDRLLPNLKKTAHTIFAMYNLFLVTGVIAYYIVGMPIFDGINHTMCALSTGGFSIKLNSIGEYNNLGVDIVTIVLMLIGTTNFAALLILVKGKFKQFLNISEAKFMFGVLILTIIPTSFVLSKYLNVSYLDGLRKSAFDISSALSTSGFSSMSYEKWPGFAIGMLIIVMLIGGGIGSTAGGIKLSRVYLMLRYIIINIKRKIYPNSKIKVDFYVKPQGKTKIDEQTINDTMGFIVTYMTIFLLGSLLITLTADTNFTNAMFEFASSIGTVGLSIGITNPTTNNATLIVEIIGMVVGRLEIFIIIFGIYSIISRVKMVRIKK